MQNLINSKMVKRGEGVVALTTDLKDPLDSKEDAIAYVIALFKQCAVYLNQVAANSAKTIDALAESQQVLLNRQAAVPLPLLPDSCKKATAHPTYFNFLGIPLWKTGEEYSNVEAEGSIQEVLTETAPIENLKNCYSNQISSLYTASESASMAATTDTSAASTVIQQLSSTFHLLLSTTDSICRK